MKKRSVGQRKRSEERFFCTSENRSATHPALPVTGYNSTLWAQDALLPVKSRNPPTGPVFSKRACVEEFPVREILSLSLFTIDAAYAASRVTSVTDVSGSKRYFLVIHCEISRGNAAENRCEDAYTTDAHRLDGSQRRGVKYVGTRNHLVSAVSCLCPEEVSGGAAEMGFEWPWQYNFPPFYTLQPNVDTRQKQLSAWSSLVLSYCRHNKLYTMNVMEIQESPLFNNKKIQRKLSLESVQVVLEELRKKVQVYVKDLHIKLTVLAREIDTQSQFQTRTAGYVSTFRKRCVEPQRQTRSVQMLQHSGGDFRPVETDMQRVFSERSMSLQC
ncbi:unnamed protein product [Ranitomeya imitator]|uniref:Vacuolar protein-sorting-associated protein 25 n=1 Tax=Ranitomeya imitator TaxID=111125 RepID=A0ABN9MHX5_9NEOB|nr:unnamed protein product [Ranitomeya imitator]